MIVSELWVPSEEDLLLINKGAPFDGCCEERARARTLSMADDALERLMAGRTNLEELIRMLPYSAIGEFRQRGLGRAEARAPLLAESPDDGQRINPEIDRRDRLRRAG